MPSPSLLGAAAPALAQYTGPATGPQGAATAAAGYTGPSSVPTMTVKQLLDTATDDQHVRLQGRIVSHDGGRNYTFADDSARIQVEIAAKRFPPNQPVSADQRVELVGEVDKDFQDGVRGRAAPLDPLSRDLRTPAGAPAGCGSGDPEPGLRGLRHRVGVDAQVRLGARPGLMGASTA